MRYPFRCGTCGAEFVISRPPSEAAAPAFCPHDGAAAERVFTVPEMNLNRPAHHGHAHGPGTSHHTH